MSQETTQPALLEDALATPGYRIGDPVPVVTEDEPVTKDVVEEAPPPIEAPPPMESLAEQVHREAHTVPESTGPSDWVPNRPNIRPPVTEEDVAEDAFQASVESQTAVEGSAAPQQEHYSANDLIARAGDATTEGELDEIEAQAQGRVTVLHAVEERRAALKEA